jgi:hypothetical protein
VAACADEPAYRVSAVAAQPPVQVAAAETAALQPAAVAPGVAVHHATELRADANADMLSAAPAAVPLVVPCTPEVSAATDTAAALMLQLPLTAADATSAGLQAAADITAAMPLPLTAADAESAAPSAAAGTAAAMLPPVTAADAASAVPSSQPTARGLQLLSCLSTSAMATCSKCDARDHCMPAPSLRRTLAVQMAPHHCMSRGTPLSLPGACACRSCHNRSSANAAKCLHLSKVSSHRWQACCYVCHAIAFTTMGILMLPHVHNTCCALAARASPRKRPRGQGNAEVVSRSGRTVRPPCRDT